jgi:hypothetical protein
VLAHPFTAVGFTVFTGAEFGVHTCVHGRFTVFTELFTVVFTRMFTGAV